MSATPNRVVIDPSAALTEAASLTDYYRNRNLILAHENLMLRRQLVEAQDNQRVDAERADQASGE